jgi:hypothetical protein
MVINQINVNSVAIRIKAEDKPPIACYINSIKTSQIAVQRVQS